MSRLPHGQIGSLATSRLRVADAPGVPMDLHEVDFLFPDLQLDPANLLPEAPQTVTALKALARTMEDPNPFSHPDPDGNSPIPAVYTYFGQFVDHDLTTLEVVAPSPPETVTDLVADGLVPMPLAQIRAGMRNARTATLDLDSVYGLPGTPGNDVPRDPANDARLLVGKVSPIDDEFLPFLRPHGKGIDNDLPRLPGSPGDPDEDRAARIGDPRNDENTIISQLHLAFLKAHNRLVDEGRSFTEARRILRQHYQHLVVHDFLKRVAEPAVVDDILEHGNQWFAPLAEPFFMPLEFSVAAFRFGHTMVRAAYDFNLNFNFADGSPATLGQLFTFTALSGQLGGDGLEEFPTLPENWIIEWEQMAGENVGAGGHARRFDTRLAATNGTALFNLRKVDGQPEEGLAAHLSARNLLRGYRFRMPTGQAVARALGVPVLTAQQLSASTGGEQAQALQNGGFLDRTPLWFYILAEARAQGHRGERLGPVGSTIIAEVLIGLVHRSADSILRAPGWQPSLPALRQGTFDLADLLRFAGVLDGGAPTPAYVVARGDSLSTIALNQLGDDERWPEIFALNRNVLRNHNRLTVGQRLILPTGRARLPQLRFYLTVPGDTLSGIAQAQLGDAARAGEIFALNGTVLTHPNRVPVGVSLQLPPK